MVEQCIADGILAEILKENKGEVIEMKRKSCGAWHETNNKKGSRRTGRKASKRGIWISCPS